MSKKFPLLATLALVVSTGALAQAEGYPADALPGQCFARVLVPDVTTVQAEQVIDTPERTEVKIIPAQYDLVDEQVLLKEETKEYVVIPATFKTVTERVMVEPERTETVVVPASTEMVDEVVVVRPAYTTWKPGTGIFGRTNVSGTRAPDGSVISTGELLCKVEVPAETRVIKRPRLVRAESTQTKVIPAKYDTISKQVIDRAPQVSERLIPAQYRSVKVRKLVRPASEQTITIPATYRTIEKRIVTSPATVSWREVLCDTNASTAKIAEVQKALTARGFATRVDGVFGADTLTAMEGFQRKSGLPVGYLTVDTLTALGVAR